jgi:uncharacterized metal-binding protein
MLVPEAVAVPCAAAQVERDRIGAAAVSHGRADRACNWRGEGHIYIGIGTTT